ncbi:MAG: circularly permuted type 2 ATP-grasp protein [Pseudomonadota bacterium]
MSGKDQPMTGSALPPLFDDYGPVRPQRRDEAFSGSGRPRSHWRGFFDWLDTAGPEGYARSAADLDRLRAESGIAFAAREDEQRADSLPVILSAGDWKALERGLVQRAELAERALADIYGPGRVLREGVMPPGLVYASKGFAAHCTGWEPPVQHWLYVYEADIARAADGRWVVLADRLDTPLGDGWLIANRIATSEALSNPFVGMGVRRLATHYAAFQSYLDGLMGWEGRLALVTGGENDPRFFSHAYFARYLNAALIEPADITVRDGAAFVKTLAGLKKLDILLRGAQDRSLDALHRPDQAARGAPALSMATRSGQLISANALGSSALAYRGLAPFAHRLAETLLEADLLVSDAPCLWLGDPKARAQVREEREMWRIEPINQHTRVNRSQKWNSREEMEALLDLEGERYCAVATPRLAHTPCWEAGRIVPSEWMMRVFACRTADGWSLAPGGVAARVEPGHPPPDLSFGKDVWVLPDPAERAAPPITLRDVFSDSHLRRTGRDLLSRVADELFWLGRNVERAEATLRVLGIGLQYYLSGNRADAAPDVLCDLIAIQTQTVPPTPSDAAFQAAVRALVQDSGEPASMANILTSLRSNAIRARSAISEESWRYIDRLCSDSRWQRDTSLARSSDLLRLITDSLGILAAFAGSAQENLTRNYAWRFLEIGRRIERGVATAKVAERLAGQARENEETYLRAWLKLSDSASAYRSRYMMSTVAPAVIDLLVLDETNPRSLVYQIERLEYVLEQLPRDTPYRRPEHRQAMALLTAYRLADAETLARPDEAGGRHDLHALTARTRTDLGQVSTLLSRAFFAHSDVAEAVISQARLGEGGP